MLLRLFKRKHRLTAFSACLERRQRVVLVKNVADDFARTKNFVLLRIILLEVVDAAFSQNALVIEVSHRLHLMMMVSLGPVVVFVVMMLLEVLRVAVMLFRILDDVLEPERVLFDL